MAKVTLAFVKCSRLYMSLSSAQTQWDPVFLSLGIPFWSVEINVNMLEHTIRSTGEELSWLVGEF